MVSRSGMTRAVIKPLNRNPSHSKTLCAYKHTIIMYKLQGCGSVGG